MKTLIILAVCAFAAGMVPKESTTTINTTTKPEICAHQTPCAWSIYKPEFKIVEYVINNTYCNCTSNLICKITEDDTAANAFVHHCRPKDEEDEAEES